MAIAIAPFTLGAAAIGGAFSGTVTASGGTAPYTFAVTAGTLPAGLTLDGATGIISGTATTAGSSTFTVTATDAAAVTGARDYTIVVSAVTLSPGALADAATDSPYSVTLAGQGGAEPYTFALIAGALPTGLTFDTATGIISGTPTESETSSFLIRATDSDGATGDQSYTLTIKPPVYWYICARESDTPLLPRRTANQDEYNRKVANALDSVSKARHDIGDMQARPVVKSIRDHLLCDGAEVSRVSFPQLFAAIGTAWGAGDGTTTFNIPNLIGAALGVPLTAPAQVITPTTVVTAADPVTEPTGPSQTGPTQGGPVTVGGAPEHTLPSPTDGPIP